MIKRYSCLIALACAAAATVPGPARGAVRIIDQVLFSDITGDGVPDWIVGHAQCSSSDGKAKEINAVYTADDDMLEGALQAYKESGRKDVKIMFGGAAKKEIVKRIMDGDPLVRADATYPPDVVATGVSVAVVGLRGRVYEGFYQKKLPLRMILPSELVTKENAKDYYQPAAAF